MVMVLIKVTELSTFHRLANSFKETGEKDKIKFIRFNKHNLHGSSGVFPYYVIKQFSKIPN